MSTTTSLRAFAKSLKRLPSVLGHRVAREAAPVLTSLLVSTFDAGENAYGIAWDAGSKGERITLVRSGSTKRGLRFVAIGAKLRVALATRWAKYQVGKRPVTPAPGAALPSSFRDTLEQLTSSLAREELAQ